MVIQIPPLKCLAAPAPTKGDCFSECCGRGDGGGAYQPWEKMQRVLKIAGILPPQKKVEREKQQRVSKVAGMSPSHGVEANWSEKGVGEGGGHCSRRGRGEGVVLAS